MKLKLNEALELQKTMQVKLKRNRKELLEAHKKGDEITFNCLLRTRLKLSKDTVSLKTQIRKANVEGGIARKIYELSELKSLKDIYVHTDRSLEATDIERSIVRLSRDINVSNNLTTIEVDLESNIL